MRFKKTPGITLKRMQAQLRAEADDKALRKWCRKHPDAPEAVELAARDEAAAFAKLEAKLERQARQDARKYRRERITVEWLVAHFEIDHRVESGLRKLNPNDPTSRLYSVRTTHRVQWKISRNGTRMISGQLVDLPASVMWASQAVRILTQYQQRKQNEY